MFGFFSKSCFSALIAFCVMNSSLVAWDDCNGCCDTGRIYIGAFGGELFSNSSEVTQMGTAFFTEAEGGPLAVLAEGRLRKKSTGFGGVQLGYEWSKNYLGCSNFSFSPAVELEAFFYSHRRRGHLINDTLRLPEHDFADSFKINSSVILANAIFSFNSPSLCGFTPYVGGGIGAARLSIRDADSLQVSPPETGINHFNSRTHDSSWAFAAQVKVGLRYDIWECFHIFGEYRYLFIDSSNYIFGSTVDPAHAPTSPWNVKIDNIQYNAFVFGIQYDL